MYLIHCSHLVLIESKRCQKWWHLTHVVAGDANEMVVEASSRGGSGGGGGATAAVSSTSAWAWSVGDKRGREEHMNEQISEPVTTFCRAYSDFSIESSAMGSGPFTEKGIHKFYLFVGVGSLLLYSQCVNYLADCSLEILDDPLVTALLKVLKFR
ncbi:Hypothetical predicted protein [Olea europaea subsp. europaea]|uniref:Uncharacterized protein n=1 Tax=Olea europaea subsp. europaea TaxID=158383 RepID=A0A8S0TXE3_OLEEU|nr:Hypothetical predicted protein [Olea europaea subsp. europaea]